MRWRNYGLAVLTFVCLSLSVHKATASASEKLGEKVSADILLQLPKYVTFSNKESNLTLCIADNSILYKLLQAENQLRKAYKDIHQISSSGANQCSAIFVSNPKRARRFITSAKGTPTLVISNYDRFIEEGGAISIVDSNGRIEIHLNLTVAQEKHIIFSPDLIELSKRVLQ